MLSSVCARMVATLIHGRGLCLIPPPESRRKLRAEGKLFHSGLPHKGINSLELAYEALSETQARPCPGYRRCGVVFHHG